MLFCGRFGLRRVGLLLSETQDYPNLFQVHIMDVGNATPSCKNGGKTLLIDAGKRRGDHVAHIFAGGRTVA